MKRAILLKGLVILTVFLVACSGGNLAPAVDQPLIQTESADFSKDLENPSTTVEGDTDADVPEWLDLPLVNARTGEPFRLSEFKGKAVILESMAVWCPSCTQQQKHIGLAMADLGEDVIAISLDTDLAESPEILSLHAQVEGFDWVFAVSSPEMNAALLVDYGPSILTAPSTPILIIAPEGTPSGPHLGITPGPDLVAMVQALLP